MFPFKGPSWNDADRKAKEELIRADQLKAKMKEHDYSECYCLALRNPPWGGYSIEEQILHEVKQRNKLIDQAESQAVRKSRYSYRYANNALTGEIVIHEPFIDELFTASDRKSERGHAIQPWLISSRLKDGSVNRSLSKTKDTAIDMLKSVSLLDSTRSRTRLVGNHPNQPKKILKRYRTPRLEELPKEILYKIIRNLNPYDLECLSEASRRLTILIGLIPCRDAFTWAVHRCQIHRHTRDASLCGDCIHAFDKRIEWVISFSFD